MNNLKNLRILVVDDEKGIRDLLIEFLWLQGQGTTAIGAMDLDSALAEASLSKPDIVITDIGLLGGNDLSGLEVIRKFSSLAVSVIGMTGRAHRDGACVKKMALDAGATNFIFKPFNLGDLWSLAEEVMNKKTTLK